MDLVPTDIAAGLMLVLQQQGDVESSLYEVRIVNPGSRPSLNAGDNVASAVDPNRDTLPQPKIWMTVRFFLPKTFPIL